MRPGDGSSTHTTGRRIGHVHDRATDRARARPGDGSRHPISTPRKVRGQGRGRGLRALGYPGARSHRRGQRSLAYGVR
eukprot:2287476-Prymnesium_polylepis.1